jgi:hypothetical protein
MHNKLTVVRTLGFGAVNKLRALVQKLLNQANYRRTSGNGMAMPSA